MGADTKIKICGLTTQKAVAAVNKIKADMAGLVFFPRSPRNVSISDACALAGGLASSVQSVALMVDPLDHELDEIIGGVAPNMLQLHGAETPERVAQIKARTGLPVMKAMRVAGAKDLAKARQFEKVADWLLFDAKPPKSLANALPGGNGLVFDWTLLAGFECACPWMLSGGLDVANVAEAIRISGARAVDVSSGVESEPGLKDPDRIRAFAAAARSRGPRAGMRDVVKGSRA
ncbi:phosphoribosylanthranilate isomerase [Pyruvatibacter mobilis]|uniref:phosphoribosylanthranilate isomerase n=1 Tax=Pyruvatibacter mobilis TaxID=1712261 RepID=UPI003C7AF7A9